MCKYWLLLKADLKNNTEWDLKWMNFCFILLLFERNKLEFLEAIQNGPLKPFIELSILKDLQIKAKTVLD